MSTPRVTVLFARRFLKNLRRLEKKFRRIRQDVKPLIDALEGGATPGDQLQGLPYTVYKVRVPNSDARRGKSGGYRVLYYVSTADMVYLIAIYSKSDLENLADDQIIDAIAATLEDDNA